KFDTVEGIFQAALEMERELKERSSFKAKGQSTLGWPRGKDMVNPLWVGPKISTISSLLGCPSPKQSPKFLRGKKFTSILILKGSNASSAKVGGIKPMNSLTDAM
ncbi:MAG: hypothetical protein Q8842_02710, partial [Candidatus Phytoplasma australasiaticum]|nr:hypothetical protein [Candidatus Phytoplasma australasiaticum]